MLHTLNAAESQSLESWEGREVKRGCKEKKEAEGNFVILYLQHTHVHQKQLARP